MMKLSLDARSFGITVNTLKRVSKSIVNTKPFFTQVESKMLGNIEKNFTSEGAYLEEKWAKLSLESIKQRVRMGYGSGPILNRTGKLKGSNYTKEKTAKRVVVSNKASYYKYHQEGTSKMVQRRIMKWTPRTIKEVEELLRDYINKIIRNG